MDFSAFIKEIGIDKFTPEEQKKMFEYAFSTLQKRMSIRLSHLLTEEQMKSVQDAAARGEQAGLDELYRVCPDYDKLYQEEIDKLKDVLK